MKKALLLFSVLALVTTATAGIDLYITSAADSQSISDAANRFNPAERNFQPAYVAQPAALPHASVAQPFFQAAGTTQTYYLWADVTGLPTGGDWVAAYQIYGIQILGTLNNATVGQNAGYRQKKTTYKRWEGVGDIHIPGATSLDGVFTAVTTPGLINDTANNARDPMTVDTDGNMKALLGAFEITMGNGGTVSLDLGPAAFAVRITDPNTGDTYNWDWSDPAHQYPVTIGGAPWGNGSHVLITPEPASMLLLGLAGLLIRRR